jgi:hypothetical protein
VTAPGELETGSIPSGVVPLVGFREWTVVREPTRPPRLLSLFHPTSWPHDRPFAAMCLRPVTWPYRPVQPAHRGVPDEDCQCGIYAFRRPEFESLNGATGPKVRGVVMGWGRYVLGALGWRAQYARLVALLDRVDDIDDGRLEEHDHADVASMIAERYEVPIVRDADRIRFTPLPRAA